MRKFAGKCLALLLALLMPLTSMPVSLAESYTSEPFNVNVETPSREEVIAAAVADNVSSGAYVELYSAVAESAGISRLGSPSRRELTRTADGSKSRRELVHGSCLRLSRNSRKHFHAGVRYYYVKKAQASHFGKSTLLYFILVLSA